MLFVHNYPMRFVALDLALLSDSYQVTELYVEGQLVDPVQTFRLVKRHDLVFAWFASYHSLLPLLFARLLGKPSVLVVGGYDIACMPAIGYGHQRGGITKCMARWAIDLATRLVTNSYYSREEAVRNIGVDAGKIVVIHHGLDEHKYPKVGPKEPRAITVGNVTVNNLSRKGMEDFVRAAHYLPEVAFLLVGRWFDEAADRLLRIAPSNVHLAGYLPDADLTSYLARSKVYVQASLHEGFGLAVAEGMLCGCIPVVTRAGALPEVVGGVGVYLSSCDPETLAEGIRLALSMDEEGGRLARERILRMFPLDSRRRKLTNLIDGLVVET